MGFVFFLRACYCGYPRTVLSLEQGLTILLAYGLCSSEPQYWRSSPEGTPPNSERNASPAT